MAAVVNMRLNVIISDPPYSSEAYSEKSVDENVVQQITNFGDDFWTILPSGSSSLSVNGERHWSESDGGESSAEELRNVLNESLRQFHIAQTALRGAGHRLRNRCAQLKEIRATCQTNLDWLGTIDKHIAASVDTAENSPLTGEKGLIRDLIERWDGLLGEVVRSEACGQWARSISEALRDIQATVVLLSNAFNPKHPSPLLIRSVQACATIHQQIQTKLSTLDTCTTDTTRLLTRISEHSTSCALCTPTSASLFADAQSLHHHLDTLSQLGRRSLDDVATYQRRLSTVRGRLTTLQSALTSSLPDLVPLHDGEAGGGRDLPGEWREVERLLQQLTGMERFVLLDAEVGEMVKEVKGMLGKMEEDGRECPRRTFLPADKPESHKLEEALPLIPEKTSVLSKPAATTTVRLPDPLLHRDSIVKVKTDILASKWRRTCLLSAPFAGLLIFLCLLAGAFLFQPHCCSYTTQKNLFTITLDYPNGSPPI
ncbi:uncharacterized protein LOC129582942 [Paramacrobiotus metropolitanus]|uniref:uncharacterized protein LOC129582942 n=1 Tax=Paramacrobiotus metropolitanus TaxID=2943436 RepID=UPI0024463858|nr:uncharacterized protein LOC129582942 [Paramacrobiotus metropolitanus]